VGEKALFIDINYDDVGTARQEKVIAFLTDAEFYTRYDLRSRFTEMTIPS
jgi:hypothetical protein